MPEQTASEKGIAEDAVLRVRDSMQEVKKVIVFEEGLLDVRENDTEVD